MVVISVDRYSWALGVRASWWGSCWWGGQVSVSRKGSLPMVRNGFRRSVRRPCINSALVPLCTLPAAPNSTNPGGLQGGKWHNFCGESHDVPQSFPCCLIEGWGGQRSMVWDRFLRHHPGELCVSICLLLHWPIQSTLPQRPWTLWAPFSSQLREAASPPAAFGSWLGHQG